MASGRWLVTSPNIEGWEQHSGEYGVKTQWPLFVSGLHALQRLNCFGAGTNSAAMTRRIVEAIPLPIAESLLFYYSFTESDFVDLKPGMQVSVERTLKRTSGGVPSIDSIEAKYRLVSSSSDGVALQLSETKNLNLAKELGDKGALIHSLARMTGGKTKLRLFLEDVSSNNVKRRPILLATVGDESMKEMTGKIDAEGESACTSDRTHDVSCITFPTEGVSLFLLCRINGKKEYKPFGTTVSQVINDKQTVLETLTVNRRISNGRYVNLGFPKTMEAVRQIILVDGDEVSW